MLVAVGGATSLLFGFPLMMKRARRIETSEPGERIHSMKIVTRLGICAALLFSLAFATACQEEGSAEKAGKAIDEAIEDAKDDVEEAKKKLEE